ncbi:hypothetical protein [Sporosarcina sp. FSL K6-3457]|uniref:hypothetical protein n=1 Tax=Sporosarcina sp. FSL K6-3457 TaxID=2978204 RepID=UPI0030F5AAB4
MKTLQKNLRNLPKYTLNEEQKERISLALQKGMKPRKKVQFVKPFIAFTLICATVFILILSNDSSFNGLKQLFLPQVELTSQQAVTFNLTNSIYEVTGIEGKVAMLFNGQFVAEDVRRGSKMMLYFWGDPPELIDKNFRVEARNTYNEKIVISEGVFNGFLFDEDVQQILTSFTPFPAEGEWQLSFYLDDQLFEVFTIEVLPPFPKTEEYSLISHPMELTVGKETEITIESSVESDKGIEVKLLNTKGRIVSEHIFDQVGSSIAAGEDMYHYNGNIIFPEQGTWTLLINGEKTKPFKN